MVLFFYMGFPFKRARTKPEIIQAFADRNGLVSKIHEGIGKKLLLLDLPAAHPVDTASMDSWIQEHISTSGRTATNECFAVAQSAAIRLGNTGRNVGTMRADNTHITNLIMWSTHGINCETLPDETTMAIDLTAAVNIDDRQGEFDVLAFRAPDLGSLCLRAGDLYGGEWHIDHL